MPRSFVFGCSCSSDALCDGCVADTFSQLRGVAACRGEVWAMRVAERVDTSQPWPDSERVLAIARSKVSDLREALANELAWWAARRWARS